MTQRSLLATMVAGLLALESTLAEAQAPMAKAPPATTPLAPATDDAQNASARDAALERERTVSAERRAVAIAASVFPGAIAHGTGHYVLRQPQTASTLLTAEIFGLVMILAGGATIALTGASRDLVGPAAAVTALGFGAFATSWAADIYGVSRGRDTLGEPATSATTIETSLGYRTVYDPQFAYRHFVVPALDVRLGRVAVRPSAWLSLDHYNARYRAEGSFRAYGPLSDRAAVDGSAIDIRIALTEHRFDADGFALTTLEAAVSGRYDLSRVGPTLEGAFVDAEVGYARQRSTYDIQGLSVPSDSRSLLLARWAFGAYLGHAQRRGGHVRIYYDHRHDGFTAGMLLRGIGSGAIGHFGLDAKAYFDEHWGVLGELQAGAAYVAGASLLFRHGGLQ